MYETETIGDALGRVRAPEELWRRIEQARAARPAHRARKLTWAFAAAAVFAGIAWNLPRPEFQSDDPAAIRAWVQQHAGFDLPLAAHSGPARVTSVHLNKGGVEVAYRAGARSGAFSVSAVSVNGAVSVNKVSRGVAAHWSSGGTSYVLACAIPGDLDAACGLCHI
jgi:hypothetical protein